MSQTRNAISSGKVVLATRNAIGNWICTACPALLQRTSTGDINDGVRAHWKTVHPDRKAV